MLMRRNVAAGIGSNEQGEYCRVALQRSDRKEPRYKWPTLLFTLLLPSLTRECKKDAKELKCLQRIVEKDKSAEKSQAELCVSNHVIAAARQTTMIHKSHSDPHTSHC